MTCLYDHYELHIDDNMHLFYLVCLLCWGPLYPPVVCLTHSPQLGRTSLERGLLLPPSSTHTSSVASTSSPLHCFIHMFSQMHRRGLPNSPLRQQKYRVHDYMIQMGTSIILKASNASRRCEC